MLGSMLAHEMHEETFWSFAAELLPERQGGVRSTVTRLALGEVDEICCANCRTCSDCVPALSKADSAAVESLPPGRESYLMQSPPGLCRIAAVTSRPQRLRDSVCKTVHDFT